MKYKVGDCFVNKDADGGISYITRITRIEDNHYCGNTIRLYLKQSQIKPSMDCVSSVDCWPHFQKANKLTVLFYGI